MFFSKKHEKNNLQLFFFFSFTRHAYEGQADAARCYLQVPHGDITQHSSTDPGAILSAKMLDRSHENTHMRHLDYLQRVLKHIRFINPGYNREVLNSGCTVHLKTQLVEVLGKGEHDGVKTEHGTVCGYKTQLIFRLQGRREAPPPCQIGRLPFTASGHRCQTVTS